MNSKLLYCLSPGLSQPSKVFCEDCLTEVAPVNMSKWFLSLRGDPIIGSSSFSS